MWQIRPLSLISAMLLLCSCILAPSTTIATVELPTIAAVAHLPSTTPTPSATFTPTQTATSPTPSVTPTPSITPTPITPTPTPSLYQQILSAPRANNPSPYLSQFRLVAFYGTPLGPELGILGLQPPEEMMRQLEETAVVYAQFPPQLTTLPTFHIIIAVADKTPPNYRHYINLDLVQQWIELAEKHEYAVILDIQPGHVSPLTEFRRIQDLLYHPHVHLAIDPEFTMDGTQIPAQNLGQLYANDINAIQQELNQIGQEIGVNRVLILHQFANSMLPDKENIKDYPNVELVIDGDGVGSPQAKTNNYQRYAIENGFEFGGFKLFPTDGDFPVLTPQEVMTNLAPPPAIIIYQ